MNEELKLWNRIFANHRKIPGFVMEIETFDNDAESLAIGIGSWYSDPFSAPEEHRSAALLVVDAIEAAYPGTDGVEGVQFCRSGKDWHSWVGSTSIYGNGAQEHISLLECLALTLEALPVTPEVQT